MNDYSNSVPKVFKINQITVDHKTLLVNNEQDMIKFLTRIETVSKEVRLNLIIEIKDTIINLVAKITKKRSCEPKISQRIGMARKALRR